MDRIVSRAKKVTLCCTAFTINQCFLVISVGNVFPLRLTHSVTLCVVAVPVQMHLPMNSLPELMDDSVDEVK